MTEPITAVSALQIIDAIDASIPKLKAFIAQIDSNPTLIAIASRLFPGVAPIIPILQQIGPYLDFLQQLTDAIQAAEGQPST